jgi:hypothetical protein
VLRGERIVQAKLAADEVPIIRHLVRSTGFSYGMVEQLYQGRVSRNHIRCFTKDPPDDWNWLIDERTGQPEKPSTRVKFGRHFKQNTPEVLCRFSR